MCFCCFDIWGPANCGETALPRIVLRDNKLIACCADHSYANKWVFSPNPNPKHLLHLSQTLAHYPLVLLTPGPEPTEITQTSQS